MLSRDTFRFTIVAARNQVKHTLSPNMPKSVKRTFATMEAAKTFQVRAAAMPKLDWAAQHRLSKGEILLKRTLINETIVLMPYYEFSSIGLGATVRRTPLGYRPLSSTDFHGLKSAWGHCALLLCTSKKLFSIFGAKRIATSYSDQHYRSCVWHACCVNKISRLLCLRYSGRDIPDFSGVARR